MLSSGASRLFRCCRTRAQIATPSKATSPATGVNRSATRIPMPTATASVPTSHQNPKPCSSPGMNARASQRSGAGRCSPAQRRRSNRPTDRSDPESRVRTQRARSDSLRLSQRSGPTRWRVRGRVVPGRGVRVRGVPVRGVRVRGARVRGVRVREPSRRPSVERALAAARSPPTRGVCFRAEFGFLVRVSSML
jgi:hypothetical protein